MAGKINEVFGVCALFRGEEIRVAIAAQEGSLSEVNGNFRVNGSFKLRFLAAVKPPPAHKEEIIEIGTGRKFYITDARPAAADSALAQEHLVGADLA